MAMVKGRRWLLAAAVFPLVLAAASSHRRPFTIAIAEIRKAVLRRAPAMPVSR